MRFTSIILLICIIFLSSFGEVVKPAQSLMEDCCKKTSKVCHHKPAQNKKNDGCNGPNCTMMFSCELCGFIVKESVRIKADYPILLKKPIVHYNTADLTGYSTDNWKPPKKC